MLLNSEICLTMTLLSLNTTLTWLWNKDLNRFIWNDWLGCVKTTDLLNNLALYIKELNQKIASLIRSYELQTIIAIPVYVARLNENVLLFRFD